MSHMGARYFMAFGFVVLAIVVIVIPSPSDRPRKCYVRHASSGWGKVPVVGDSVRLAAAVVAPIGFLLAPELCPARCVVPDARVVRQEIELGRDA